MTPVTYPLLGIIDSQKSGHLVTSNFFSIATVTASGGESSLSFTSIPSTYSHLQIRAIIRGTSTSNSSDGIGLHINSDTGNNYSYHSLYGNGSTVSASGVYSDSQINSIAGEVANGATANVFGANIIDIADYANVSKNKTIKWINGSDTNISSTHFGISLSSAAWYSTTAISSITFIPGVTFAAGSTFALYGIK